MTTMGPAFDREYALLSKIEALTIERDCYKAALEEISGRNDMARRGGTHSVESRARMSTAYEVIAEEALAGKSRQGCPDCRGSRECYRHDKFAPSSDSCVCFPTRNCRFINGVCTYCGKTLSSKDPEPARCRCGATMDDEHTYYCKNAPRSGEVGSDGRNKSQD